MIKKIHYCWFGGKKLPREVKKCIETWKKFLPDYEIIEWNESKFDVNKIPFVKSAYENKKWAFVSDYVRTYALYEEGGLYLDTDVKILKDVSKIIDKNLSFGYEDSGYFGTAVIATNKVHNPYIKEVLEYYDSIESINLDIIYNYANPAIITRIINKYPVELQEDGIKIFNGEVCVYPRDYFYPLSYNYAEKIYTKNTCMVHLFNGTWTDKGEQRTINLYRKFGLGFGGFLNKLIDSIFNIRNSLKSSILKLYKKIRMKISIYLNRKKRVLGIRTCLNQKTQKYIAICHPDIKDIKDNTYKNFKDNVIELREQHTKKEAQMMAKEIVDSGKKLIIFNSYVEGWDEIMNHIKHLNPKIKIKVIISFGNEILSNPYYWEMLDILLTLYFKGIIDEFGFNDKNSYEFYKQKGYKCTLLLNDVNIKDNIYKKENTHNNNIKIGLYYNDDNMQNNIYNQLSAVSLMQNIKLDCIPLNYRISGLAKKFDINLSGNQAMLSQEEMNSKLAQNDINLNIIYSESSELLHLQSFEVGTICLISNNINCFSGFEIEKYIVVQNPNNIIEIKEKIENALKNKEKILELYKIWKNEYSKNIQLNLKKFLEI